MTVITRLDNAVVMAGAATLLEFLAADRADPLHRNVPLKGIGVRTADDAVAAQGAVHYRHRVISPISIAAFDGEVADFPGDAIFGGIVGPHFGHVISQAVGRLWVAESLPTDVPIIFLNANAKLTLIPEYFVDLVRVLGLANPLVLLTTPTRVERLYLGPDLCNLERRPAVDPFFLDWLHRHRPAAMIDPGLWIYVSRSKMGVIPSQYLQEQLLEEALRNEGYQIIHPENLAILDQIDLYRSASRLVFADGSAVHLWSLFSADAQKVAVVQRRPWERTLKTLRRWLRGFSGPDFRVFDHIIAQFHGRGTSGKQPVALLDMESLWRDLGAAGFHSGTRTVRGARQWFEAGAGDAFEWDEVSIALLATRPNLSQPKS